MVVVLPWYHPVRVAEQVLLLDHFSHGRTLLGVGRGIGRIEYEKLGVDQAESKALSIELIRCLTSTLESGVCEYDGETSGSRSVQLPRPPVVPRQDLHRRGVAGDVDAVRGAGGWHAGDSTEGA
jgi:alkanesulfonate monooxygenase SsuD/methylene tetrahydromethanopterin reductase-like flavin-dependent oxidoreductase (luciferase family)